MKSLSASILWIPGLAALWLILSAGDSTSWVIGIPFIMLALVLMPTSHTGPDRHNIILKFVPLLRFTGFFMWESLRGGIDVSRRVMSRQPRINPGFFDYAMRLQSTHAQQLFIGCISLLPGTLCAEREAGKVNIHALDQGPQPLHEIKRLESLVASLFGESI